MILMVKKVASLHRAASDRFVVVFGAGLIGGQCLGLLKNRGYEPKAKWDSAWNVPQDLTRNIDELCSALGTSGCAFLDVLWSGGKAGFDANEETASAELSGFQLVMNALQAGCERHGIQYKLVMLSSAGGIFEGQALVDSECVPTPLRPYGRLKLNQEQYANSLKHSGLWILRPTSVFGTISLTKRMGLIPKMIFNASTGQPTSIFGRPDTLRDYVSVEDVARVVVHCLESQAQKNVQVDIVCSGKPSSIFEIQRHVEEVVRTKMSIVYVNQSNAQTMTFRPCRLATLYKGGGLREQIAEIYRNWQFERR
jgi:nucleoside-diphosphate-sugar epimerase